LHRLLRTAEEIHSSVDTDAVTGSLAHSAKELLRARDAWVGTSAPELEERGVRLPLNDDQEQWLVVSGRKGVSGFDSDDVQLLEAIGAIGASALENAHLVSQIRHQATHDRLTGLPNQLLFEDRVNQAVQRARRLREKLSVLMVDLDGFQKVNASLGHAVGNELLKRVGGRLTSAVREGDTVARMSADDFTILLPGLGDGEGLGIMAEQLLGAVSRPFVVDGHELFMTSSVGIAVFPDDGSHAGQLLRNADTAMHRAKDAGGNCSRLYDPGTNEQAQVHLARRSELHNALRRDELRVLYQPQIDLRTGHVVGVEALVRWEHPTLGLLTPADFVPLAEESDLVVEVDTWVMRHACQQAVEWDAAGLPPLRMAANLSGRNFSDDRIIGRVAMVLQETGLAADRLELEITESLALRESEGALDIIRRVRDLGPRFAIDDFGTGYSALAQMQRFPVDRLKIDRTFVSQITSAQGVAPLVSAFIGIARALRLEVVAEGVETLEQQTFLRTHGCKEAQGYLYSRPVPPDEIVALVRKPSLGLHVGGSASDS
jgi:diguanylate cyclase (GGDEF)-like protein